MGGPRLRSARAPSGRSRRAAADVVWAAALFALLAGCGILPLELEPEPTACPAALLEGTLVADDGQGIGVREPSTGVAYPVAWPEGWQVRGGEGGSELLNDGGQVVGREGDQFSAGGGFTSGPDEVFIPCGPIDIVPAP